MLASSLLLLLSLAPAVTTPAAKPVGPDPTFLRAYAETRRFTLGYPTRIRPTPDGRAVLFLRSPSKSPVLGLYETDVATGQTRELVTPAALLKGGEEVLSAEEKARRERQRVTARGFASFDLSEDGARVLLPLSGRLFVYEREGQQAGKVRALTDGKAPTGTPRFSPDGGTVAYVKQHDVWTVDVATGKERRVTKGGTEAVTHGSAEFIAQEEMHRFDGFWWSPDGKQIAFEEVDHGGLERFTIADPSRPERVPDSFPYPRPGKANVKVRLGVTPAVGGKVVWVAWDQARYPYLARVVWREKKAPLTILVQSRDQREEALLAVDGKTGKTRTLLLEKDEAWVEIVNGLPRWLPDGSGFLWASDRSGLRQLELHKASGELDRVLVGGEPGFLSLEHLSEDGKTAYALRTTSVTSSLWRVPLDGGAPAAVVDDKAEHAPSFARNGALWVDTTTSVAGVPESVVVRADGSRGPVLPSVAEPLPWKPNVELTIAAGPGDGARAFQAALVRPRAFDKNKRYPVIVSVYGGPGALEVRNDARGWLLAQWLADHGAVVVAIDNRGTPRRDRAWSRAIKGSFGRVPLDDQVEGLRALGARYKELDLARVGIYGWSFGGFMAALAVMKRPDVYKAAVAGAPVVDWLDYDTHYTERYLDLPDKNPRGYDESSLLTYAAGLARPLLLIHGTADDNVYFFHTLKLTDALFRAGRPFELLPLPGQTHMVPEPLVVERMYERMADFLMGHLK